MPTISQFESALNAKYVQIEEMRVKTLDTVQEAIGYKDRKRMVWDATGKCTQNKVRIPENDLKFPDNDSLSD